MLGTGNISDFVRIHVRLTLMPGAANGAAPQQRGPRQQVRRRDGKGGRTCSRPPFPYQVPALP
ncbi:hypothetical protein DVDV_3095 [Desulfovibrio sp. DV]|nr:hypothetical protein DVDV_3095 [Desulfovibrio sp. DV]